MRTPVILTLLAFLHIAAPLPLNVPALQAATLAVREDNEAVDSPNDDAASTTVINLTSRDEDDSAEDSGDDSAASTEVINLAH